LTVPFTMPNARRARLKELLADLDLGYAIAVLAAVAVFIGLMFAYFGAL